MHRLSDGQRRRVQILLGLSRQPQLLLLHEVTADLDVRARFELLQLLRRQSEQSSLTVVYATHIFDGLEDWATHLIYLRHGQLDLCRSLDDIEELRDLRRDRASNPLHRLVVRWLARDRAGR